MSKGKMSPINYPIKIKRIPTNKKLGHIQYDTKDKPKDHELITAKTLAKFGYDIFFMKKQKFVGASTADCKWRNLVWEIKRPEKNRKETFIRDVKEAANHQSCNIIIDVRKSRREIRQVAIDIISYIKKRRTHKIQRIVILDEKNYCYFTRSDIL